MQSVTMGPRVHISTNLDSTPTFKNGQILFLKIHKMYPNQMAEVQIGNQKIMANLEVPLKAGEHYWLQVQQSEGKPILKMLDAPSEPKMTVKGAALTLLAQLGVVKTTAATELAEFLIKDQLPITKESFQLALQWLKTADSPQIGLATIKAMFIQQLPFVEDVFKALLAQLKGESFHEKLRQLFANVISSTTETTTTTQLKGILESLVVPKQGKIQEMGLSKLLSHWLEPNSTGDIKTGAYSLLQKTGLISPQLSEAEFLTKLVNDSQAVRPSLAKTDISIKWQQGLHILFDYKTALQNGDKSKANELFQNFSKWLTEQSKPKLTNSINPISEKSTGIATGEQAFLSGKNGTVTAKINIEPSTQSNQFQQNDAQKLTMKVVETLFTEAKNGSEGVSGQNKSAVDAFLNLLNPDGRQVSQAKTELTNQLLLFSQNRGESQLLPNERAVLQLLATEFPTPDLTNATAVSSHLKDLAKMLGLQFEHVLANADSLTPTRIDEELTTLKPLLLKLLKEHHPSTVKELAEQIVSRITAQQIISQENGPLQNVLLTLPLHLGNYQTDVTLQWSGRKTKEGDIDPSYCRILFYLDLEQLKETVIDMQVQNRVIKIVVFNEQNELIEAASSSYISTLRKNLEQLDYKLSGVLFENIINENVNENQNQLVYPTASSYSGVDIRI